MITSIEKNIELYNKQNAIHVDYKFDYMARLFRKISHKRFECYVVQRIWHSLNDDRVKFVVQQYASPRSRGPRGLCPEKNCIT